MIYPLVKEMAAVGAPVRVAVAVACRVLGFSKQGYYKWLKQPVSAREAEERELIAVLHQLHDDDPEGGYRVLADDITELGYTLSERRVWRLCRIAGIQSVFTTRKTRYKKAGAPVHDDLVNRQFSAEGPQHAVADRHHRAPHPRGQGLPVRDQGRVLQPDRRLLDRLADEGPDRRQRARDGSGPPRPAHRGDRAFRPRVPIPLQALPQGPQTPRPDRLHGPRGGMR